MRVTHLGIDALRRHPCTQIYYNGGQQIRRRVLFVQGNQRQYQRVFSDFRGALKAERLLVRAADAQLIPAIYGANRQSGKAQALCLDALQEHKWVVIRLLNNNKLAFELKARQSLAEFNS